MENKICIIGCGGHARSVADVILNNVPSVQLIFADENAHNGETIFGYPVVRDVPLDAENIFVAIGDNEKRRELANGKQLISIVAHSATVSSTAVIEDGCFIGAGAHIGPFAHIGRGTIVNTNAVVEHEVGIGAFSHLAPNSTVCGRTRIGDNVFLGAGTTVKDGVEICSDVVVGAGSVVIKDISKAGMYVGTPAKIKENRQ